MIRAALIRFAVSIAVTLPAAYLWDNSWIVLYVLAAMLAGYAYGLLDADR